MSSPSTSGSEPGAGFRLLRLETAAGGAPLRPPAAAGESPLQPPAAAGADPSGGGHAAPGGSAAAAPATAPAAALAVAELLIPATSPIFAGHFPGRPLLPGIAHLALLRQVLDALAGRGEVGEIGDLGGGGLGTPAATAIIEVHRLRLRQPVSPGER
ncbi:MAG TPA: hypothetical protein VKY89_10275, partial [Thermoanaerobaculia bacterium]|nr:hypothetical protein [Thermoanaerobaculia bacterium]